VVEDHSASAEFTPAEETPSQYTRPDHAEPQHTGDGGQDLRPDPVADFRTEVAPTEFRTGAVSPDFRADFRAEIPRTEFPHEPRPTDSAVPPAAFQTERFPEPAPRTDATDHLSPSLPIPMPEPPESGYRPAPRPEYDGYRYRSDLERAATDLPTGPVSEPSAGTAYFGAAPVVGDLGYPGANNGNAWSGQRYAAEGTGSGDVAARNEGDARADGGGNPEPRITEPRRPETRIPETPAAEQRPVDQRPMEQPPVEQRPVEPQPRPAEPRPEAAGPVMDLGDAWTRVLAGLPPNQRAWLTNSRPVTLHESTAIVAVPDDFTRGQLETRLRPDLERILTESFGRDIRIAVTVDPSLDPELREPQAPPQPAVREPLRTDGAFQPTIQSALTDPDQGQQFGQPRPEPVQRYEQPAPQHYDQPRGPAPQQQQPFGTSQLPNGSAPAHPPTDAQGEARLNPKYTFETFVIGSSNRFAHAAAVAVAEAPGKAYNPQLIYGDSGLGKTHLLHAIGHYVRSLYTGARVRYVSSEEFTNDFINAIRDDKASQFQRRYRDVDVLLIDDIQFLEGKIQTQEEFFHTFNTLHNANKQIVISSDRAPKRLEALEDRLRNRFEWGLITDIQPPDLETRIAILRKKAATERLTAPPEVLEFIASKVQTNIRELEGALIRVTAFASLNRQPVDLSLAEIVLKDLIPEGSKPEVTASMIMGQTASYFGLSIDDLCGSSRSRVLVTARQIAMYLCRELTDLSLPKIGQQFGGRDHTTVMHAERKIRQLMSERRSVFNQVTELTNRIKHQAKQQ
jgi:chromosomal replication initiator protein DnaA